MRKLLPTPPRNDRQTRRKQHKHQCNEKGRRSLPHGEPNGGLPSYSLFFFKPQCSNHTRPQIWQGASSKCRLSRGKTEILKNRVFATFSFQKWRIICENTALLCGVFCVASFINTFWYARLDSNQRPSESEFHEVCFRLLILLQSARLVTLDTSMIVVILYHILRPSSTAIYWAHLGTPVHILCGFFHGKISSR